MDVQLDEETYALLQREQAVLQRMKELFEKAGSDPEVTAQLADLVENLGELFLVVVVGEFNAGKSRLLNALFGQEVMPEGPTPTTDKITLLRHGEKEVTRPRSDVMVEKRAPIEMLRDVAFVDTPGTNSIVQEHQQVTEDFIPRSDLVLFITSYDRPLSDSERQFLEFIREDWGRRLVFVVNKADLARSEEDLQQVIAHVKDGCRELLHFEPEVFPVSAEKAYEARIEGEGRADERWGESRFEALEDFMQHTLSGTERVAIKLSSPLEAGERLLGRFSEELADRRDVLSEDEDNLDFLESEIEDVRAELEGGYERHLAEIDKLLMKIEQRGTRFLEDNIRVSKIGMLRNKDRFKEEFERQVVRDLDRQIEGHVTEAVDQLTERALKLERQTLRTLGKRMREAGSQLPGSEGGEFTYNRAEVHGQIMRSAEREMKNLDMEEESRRILENVYNATDLLQKGGLVTGGVAGLSVVLIAAAGLDTLGGFGLATSAAVAGAGLFVLPRQREKAKRQLTEHVEELRADLHRALSGQLDREIDKAMEEMRETVQPYAEMVSEERETLREAEEERDELAATIEELRTEVEKRVGSWEREGAEKRERGKAR
ncbi:MAG: dynamin [Bacteroidetes bacterium QS_9_68_14]|nr:MAG: dynamin [Bacteroidetes bacterium QS_9_68_14]